MTLAADQLFRLLASAEAFAADIVAAGGFPTSGLLSAIADANQQTLMMETPITAEALKAAGWVRDEAWMPGWYGISLADEQTLDLCIEGRLRFVVNESGDAFWFAGSNMYDLAELVRLLGGENA